MKSMKTRIQTLEAQINAMAQAWLYLAAHIEMQCGVPMENMEAALRKKQWPQHPDIDPEAQAALHWLCGELEGAREIRLNRGQGH